MLAIKLKIVGRRNQRTFRVIVQEARSKLGGKFVEDLGWYNPHANQFKVNKERVSYWIANGAQPTDSVSKLLTKVESSEVGTYEAREGRKKKKGSKGESGGGAPAAPAESETQAQAGAELVAEDEVPPAEEAPAEDATAGAPPAPEESVKEKTGEEGVQEEEAESEEKPADPHTTASS